MKNVRYALLLLLALLASCGGGNDSRQTSSLLASASVRTLLPAADYNTAVQQFYIAYFGRPADTSGLANFSAALSAAGAPTTLEGLDAAYRTNAQVRTLIDSFGISAESAALYTGDTQSFVRAIYLNILNRTADDEGLQFWSNAIDSNTLTRGLAALSIMAGALSNTTPQGLIDGAIVTNKTAVGSSFTASLVSDLQVAGYSGDAAAAAARAMLATVTDTTDTDAFQTTVNSTIEALIVSALPGAPVITLATAGNTSATITFNAPASSGTSSIISYTATCTGNGGSANASGSGSPIVVSGMTNGSLYSCSVTATNSAGAGPASDTLSVTPAIIATVPGAPTIGTATAGNGSASIAFTAPASNGDSAITGYTVSCAGGGSTKTGTGTASPILVSSMTNSTVYSCSVTATNAVGTGAASGTVSVTPSSVASTASVYCPHSSSVYNAGLNLTSTMSMTCSSTLRTIVGNGVPDHTTGTFPNSGNPNTIGAVNVSYSNTLAPALVSSTGTSVAHKIGYANNSVAFDPATAESYQNQGVWKIEALNQTYFPFGVDSSNAHVQPDGAYHYHGMPVGYMTLLGKGTAMTLVGFALDGFPIYARYGYTTATDSTSAIKVMTSSYRMKTSPDGGRPSTGTVAMGTFTQDYEYVAGLGDLDQCNGRYGVTPEFPAGIYHYYITDTYPYIQRCVKGTASYNGTIGN